MWTRKELKAKAKVEYKKNPWMSVLASLVLLTLSGALNTYFVKGANNAAIDQGYDSLANALIEGSAQFVIAVLTVMAAALLVGVALRIFVLNPLNASCTTSQNIQLMFSVYHHIIIRHFFQVLFLR